MEKELIYYIKALTEDTVNDKVSWERFNDKGVIVYVAKYHELSILLTEADCLLVRTNKNGEIQFMAFEKNELPKQDQEAWDTLLELVKTKATDMQ